jgi:hypothetical protein
VIPDPISYAAEEDLIIKEGLAAVALQLVDQIPSLRDTTTRAHLFQATSATQMHSLAADLATQPLLRTLSALGVPAVVIKGPAVARFHPLGWPRPYSDLDLLVPYQQFEMAVRAAVSAGFLYPEYARPPWPMVDRYCREGVNLHGRANVDIHHHLPPWVFGEHLHLSEVAAAASPCSLHGMEVQMASREHSAVIAALHMFNDLWKGRLGLMSWRDFVILFRSSEDVLLQSTFRDLGLEWLLDLVTTSLSRSLPEANIHATGNRPLPRDVAWRMRILGWDRTSSLARHRGAWVGRLPLANAVAFLAASAVPSPGYIRDRHSSYGRYWLRAWRETVSTLSGADFRSSDLNRYSKITKSS